MCEARINHRRWSCNLNIRQICAQQRPATMMELSTAHWIFTNSSVCNLWIYSVLIERLSEQMIHFITILLWIAGANIEPSNRPLCLPSIDLNVLQIQNKINENNEPKGEVQNDSFSLAAKTLEVPNIHAKPAKSILKNSSSVRNEMRAPAAGDDIDCKYFKCYTFFPVNISNLYHFAIDPLDGNAPLDEFPGFTQVRNVNLVCWNGIIKSDLCFESSIQVLGDIVERSNANETQTVSQPNDFQMTCTQKSDVSTKTEPKKRVSLFKKSRMSWFGDWYDFQSNIRFAPKIISIKTVSSWWSK